nr:MAG TPA: hypothetical protein [Caudoviricetes sp.]
MFSSSIFLSVKFRFDFLNRKYLSFLSLFFRLSSVGRNTAFRACFSRIFALIHNVITYRICRKIYPPYHV